MVAFSHLSTKAPVHSGKQWEIFVWDKNASVIGRDRKNIDFFLGQIFNKYLIIFGKIFGKIFDFLQNIDFSPKILIFKVLKQGG